MSTAEYARAAGFDSLEEVARIINKATSTLRRWHKRNPALFFAVLRGAAMQKLMNDIGA